MAAGDKPVALVIEDDPQILALLKLILEREGFAVETAADGRAALERIEAMAAPAVVTVDVMLPYVDGFQLLARMRSRAGWEGVPVLMLTAKSQEKDIVRGLDAGAADYLVKPFKPEELRARVRRMVKR